MMRFHSLRWPVIIGLLSALLFAWMLLLQTRGYSSASNLDLWGRTLLANSGLISLEDVVTAFPPLPYIGTIVTAWLLPDLGIAAPRLFAALLAGGLASAWLASFRMAGFGPIAAFFMTLALVANPLFLRALAEGPGFVILLWGMWLLSIGIFQLRTGRRVNEIILVSVSLILISLAHPFGMVVAFAALPFLALVAPPDRLRQAPMAVFLVLLFPLIFTLAAFAYVNWIFAGNPLHFILNLSRETAGLGTISEDVGSGSGTAFVEALLVPLGIVAAVPIATAIFARTDGIRNLRLGIIALMGTLTTSATLAFMIDVLPSSLLIVSLGLPLAAACAIRWPYEGEGRAALPRLMMAGLAGALLLTMVDTAPETVRWRQAVGGKIVNAPDLPSARLGEMLAKRNAILFDAEAAPAIVAARGHADGIWSADTSQFQLMSIRKPNNEPAVLLVRNRMSSKGSDRVGQLYPNLYDEGRTGYRMIFDDGQWRAYARSEEARS